MPGPEPALEHLERLLDPEPGAADVLHRIGSVLGVLQRPLKQHVGREQGVAQLVREQPRFLAVELDVPIPITHRGQSMRGAAARLRSAEPG